MRLQAADWAHFLATAGKEKRKIPPHTHTDTDKKMELMEKKRTHKNGQLGRAWRNVKNYIICAEKCAYIFSIRKADQAETAPYPYIFFLFYAKLLRFTIHCIFNLVGFGFSFWGFRPGQDDAARTGKGPGHINKDFISFICSALQSTF